MAEIPVEAWVEARDTFFRSIRKDLFDGVQVQSAFFPPLPCAARWYFGRSAARNMGAPGGSSGHAGEVANARPSDLPG